MIKEQCSICGVAYINGKQDCNCNAGPLQPLSSNLVSKLRGICQLASWDEAANVGNAAAEEIQRVRTERDKLHKQLLEHAEVCGESAYPISDRIRADETDAPRYYCRNCPCPECGNTRPAVEPTPVHTTELQEALASEGAKDYRIQALEAALDWALPAVFEHYDEGKAPKVAGAFEEIEKGRARILAELERLRLAQSSEKASCRNEDP